MAGRPPRGRASRALPRRAAAGGAPPGAARRRDAGLRLGGARGGARRAAAYPAAAGPAPHRHAARLARGAPRRPARPAAARRYVLVRGGGPRGGPDDRRRHRVRAARALQARRGRLGAGRAVRADHGPRARGARGCRAAGAGRVLVTLERDLEALLFLAPDPVPVDELADALRVEEEDVAAALRRLTAALDGRGVVLREIGGGWTLASHPDAEE